MPDTPLGEAGVAPSSVAGSPAADGDWTTSAWVVLGCWLLFAAPWLLGRVTIPYDAKALFQAQLQFLATALHTGQSPAWNPFTFVGIPQIADPQSLIFSPALLLATLSRNPGFWLLDAYVFLLLGLAAAAILLFFRDRGWHPAGAAVAALCFAFGGSASWRMQHIGQIQSYAFFALTLWLLFRARDRQSIRWGALAGLAAGLMLIEPDQVAMLACYLVAVMLAVDWLTAPLPMDRLRRDLWPCATAAAVAIIVAGVPLLLTYLFLAESNRPSIALAEAVRGSLHPASLLTYLLPDLFGINDKVGGYWGPYSEPWDPDELTLSPNMSQLYMGALPCLVLLRGLLDGTSLRSPEIAGLTTATAAALLYALGTNTPAFRLIYDLLPAVSLFRRPADATYLLGGLASILVGYLIHLRCTGEPEPQRRSPGATVATLVLATLAAAAIAYAHGRLSVSLLPIATGLAMLAVAGLVLAIPPSRLLSGGRLAMFVPALLVGADLAIANGPSESTGKPPDRAQDALLLDTRNETIDFLSHSVRRGTGTPWRDRIEIAGVGFDWQNTPEAHGLEQTLGYNPLRTELVTRALGAGDYIAGWDQRRFSRLFPSYRCLLADLLGLRFVVTPVPIERLDHRVGPHDLPLVARTRDAFIYENPRALPRVMLVGNAMGADFERILRDGRWPDFDPRRTVLLGRADMALQPARLPPRRMSSRPVGASVASAGAPVPPSDHAADPNEGGAAHTPQETMPTAVMVRYRNTHVAVDTTTARAGYLVLNDVWHPWWRATVDGKPTPIRQANVLFRAVALPAGHHRVEFHFDVIAGAFAELSRKLWPQASRDRAKTSTKTSTGHP